MRRTPSGPPGLLGLHLLIGPMILKNRPMLLRSTALGELSEMLPTEHLLLLGVMAGTGTLLRVHGLVLVNGLVLLHVGWDVSRLVVVLGARRRRAAFGLILGPLGCLGVVKLLEGFRRVVGEFVSGVVTSDEVEVIDDGTLV